MDQPDATSTAYFEFLLEKGYEPSLDERGVVRFRAGDLTFVIMPSQDDPQFFRLLLPGIWRTSDELERREAIDAANKANAETKVAKVFLLEDGGVHASLELFAASPAHLTEVIPRSINALRLARRTFINGLAL